MVFLLLSIFFWWVCIKGANKYDETEGSEGLTRCAMGMFSGICSGFAFFVYIFV